MPKLSIIVASSGRPSLDATVLSITQQMEPGDELLLDVNDDAPWGHAARNRQMLHAKGDALCFIDDDDVYVDDAFEVIREKFERDPEILHVFKMRYLDGRVIWSMPALMEGNVSTQMVVVPNLRRMYLPDTHLPQWGDRYQGDWDFINAAGQLLDTVVWHDKVIAEIGRT